MENKYNVQREKFISIKYFEGKNHPISNTSNEIRDTTRLFQPKRENIGSPWSIPAFVGLVSSWQPQPS